MAFVAKQYANLFKHGLNVDPFCNISLNFLFKSLCVLQRDSKICNSMLGAYSYMCQNGIMNNCWIGNYTSIAANVKIGLQRQDLSKVATSSLFVDSSAFKFAGYSAESMKLKPPVISTRNATIKIGNDVWIGTDTIICEDVVIGDGAVIGAGALITKDVPPYSVVVNQDQILRFRFSDEIISDLIESQWWKYDIPKMITKGTYFPFYEPQKIGYILKHLPDSELLELPRTWHMIFVPDNLQLMNDLKISSVPDSVSSVFFNALKTK